jgi:O-antigen/teichoic acid export membrane protein
LSLIKDTFFYSLANWGQRLVGLVMAPIVIAYFTPGDYGYISLVGTLASFFSILSLLAVLDQGLPRFFIDSNDEEERKGYVTTSFLVGGIGMTGMTLIILSGTPLIPMFFTDIKVPIVFTLLTALACIAQSFQYVGSNMLKWTFQSPLFTKIALAKSIMHAGLAIGGIVLLGWRAKEVLLVGALVTILAGAWANWSVKEYVKPSMVSRTKLKKLVGYSWPLLGLNIFAFFTRSLDRIFLASLASLSAVGIFTVSYTVASLFETLVVGFFFAWGPYMLSTFREAWAPQRYAQFFSIFSCLGIVCIIGLGLWGSPIVLLFRPDGTYKEIGVFIPWIISGTLIYYLGGYFAPGPAIRKKTYWKLYGFMLAAGSNGLLNYILIPRFGILGAGIATTTSSLFAGTFNQIVSNKLYLIPNKWRRSFIIIVFFTALVSFLQHDAFAYNINSISTITRAVITIVLLSLGVTPFYRTIKDSEVFQKVIGNILKKESQLAS